MCKKLFLSSAQHIRIYHTADVLSNAPNSLFTRQDASISAKGCNHKVYDSPQAERRSRKAVHHSRAAKPQGRTPSSERRSRKETAHHHRAAKPQGNSPPPPSGEAARECTRNLPHPRPKKDATVRQGRVLRRASEGVYDCTRPKMHSRKARDCPRVHPSPVRKASIRGNVKSGWQVRRWNNPRNSVQDVGMGEDACCPAR